MAAGYDRRALSAGRSSPAPRSSWPRSSLAPAPPAPASNPSLAVNLNYVHGLSYETRQTVMHPLLWLGIMLVGFPLVFYLPAHLALSKWFPRARQEQAVERSLENELLSSGV